MYSYQKIIIKSSPKIRNDIYIPLLSLLLKQTLDFKYRSSIQTSFCTEGNCTSTEVSEVEYAIEATELLITF